MRLFILVSRTGSCPSVGGFQQVPGCFEGIWGGVGNVQETGAFVGSKWYWAAWGGLESLKLGLHKRVYCKSHCNNFLALYSSKVG